MQPDRLGRPALWAAMILLILVPACARHSSAGDPAADPTAGGDPAADPTKGGQSGRAGSDATGPGQVERDWDKGVPIRISLEGVDTAPVHPPANLVRLDNPSSAAFLRHEIEARFNPEDGTLQAEDRITVLHQAGTSVKEPVPFLLWKDLEIESATGEEFEIRIEPRERMNPRSFWRRPPYDELDGYGNARHYDLVLDGAKRMHWPDTLRFTIRYSGLLLDSLQAPKAAYARGFETTAGLIEERGAFLAGSSFWIPSRPEELFTYRLAASVPEDWRAVSQGALLGGGRTTVPWTGGETPGYRTDIWNCPHPMEEIYLVAGPWELREREHGRVAMQTFTYADTDSALCERYLGATSRYLDLYEERIGPYPFAKFAMVENFWQTGYGMPSFTLLGNRVIRLPFIVDTSYGHEILHNWWGNGVFVDYEKGNWCEGLTVYGADYLYKKLQSEEAAREYRLNALASYLDYVSGPEDMPLTQFRSRHDFASQAIGYSKSMMVIHELYRRAGEEKFWHALQRFYKDNLWTRASWDDLLNAFAQTAGLDADSFRQSWIERSGAPKIMLEEARLTKPAGTWQVHAALSQEPSQAGGEPYDLIVPVRLEWEGGDSTWMVPMNTARMEWTMHLPQEPTRIWVDPGFDMMRRISPSEVPATLSRTLGSDTLTVVIASGLDPALDQAYRQLAAEWAGGQTLVLVDEDEVRDGWTPATSVWFLGLGTRARAHAERVPEVRRSGRAWTIAGQDWTEQHGAVITGALDESHAWSLLDARDPEQIAALGRKVPHYGKYSYLVFEGDAAVGKGVWTETDSPLVQRF